MRAHASNLSENGLKKFAIVHCGDLPSFFAKYSIAPTMVFVDGDHRYAGVKADVACLSDQLLPDVPVFFYDYLNTDTVGVRKAVDEWCAEGYALSRGTSGCSALVVTTERCRGRLHTLSGFQFLGMLWSFSNIVRALARMWGAFSQRIAT